MVQSIKIIAILIFSILSSSLLFTGCTTHKQPEKKVITSEHIHEMVGKTLYVKKDLASFKQGEAVTVLSVEDLFAVTDKGRILLSDLEEQRSTFRLTINTLDSAQIRILNIKPKYSEGMWLKTGKYHIEVSADGYKKHKQWIVLYRDKVITIPLKKLVISANGILTWQRGDESYSVNGVIFQMQSADRAQKMRWDTAKEYCSGLNISLFGFRADQFSLPTDSELLQLSQATRPYEHSNAVYWTATTDSEHQSYAKYVNINSGENSWYKKHGKTYVLCRQETDVDLTLSLDKLARSLLDNKVALLPTAAININEDASENRRAINALEMALFLKYGNPVLQNVSYYTDDQVLSYEITSQNRNSDGKPFFYKKIRVLIEDDDVDVDSIRAQLMDPGYEPIVDFDIVNGKLIFLGM